MWVCKVGQMGGLLFYVPFNDISVKMSPRKSTNERLFAMEPCLQKKI